MGEGYHTLTDMDDPAAAFAQYWAYARGTGVPRDTARAMERLRVSAEAGYAPAQSQLASEIFGPDKDEALRWYLAAAAQGNAAGQLGAARMLYHGRFVEPDEERGLALYAAAAAQGDEDAVREHAVAVRQVAAMARSDDENLAIAIHEHGLDGYADAIRALARPSVRLVATKADDATIPIGASKIGGAPDLPAYFKWPMREGRRLAFIAQIELTDLRRFPPVAPELPREGLLSFFYDAEKQPWGRPDEFGGWFIANHVPIAKHRHSDAATFRSCSLEMFAELTLPPVRSALARSLPADAFERYGDLHDTFTSVYRRRPRADGEIHRVGGHPDAIQGDMTRRIVYGEHGVDLDATDPALEAEAREWLLLLQLDSDHRANMMWGDLGRLYFWMTDTHFRGGHWDEARLQLQCS
jgi:hypothetical protein